MCQDTYVEKKSGRRNCEKQQNIDDSNNRNSRMLFESVHKSDLVDFHSILCSAANCYRSPYFIRKVLQNTDPEVDVNYVVSISSLIRTHGLKLRKKTYLPRYTEFLCEIGSATLKNSCGKESFTTISPFRSFSKTILKS